MNSEYSARVPRYHRVRLALQQDIEEGKLLPGDILPAEKVLCEQYGVSSITIRRALGELVKAGLIYRVNGVGTFVSIPKRDFSIALIFVGFEEYEWRTQGRMFGSLIGGVGQAVWEHGSVLRVMHFRSVKDLVNELERIIEEKQCDGVLLRTSDDPPAGAADLLLTQRFPHVFVKKLIPERPVNSVEFDNFHSARRATEHLLDLGHINIACVLGRPTTTFKARADGFRQAMENRCSIAFPREFLRHGRDEFAEAGLEETRALLGGKPRPTAIVIGSDHMGQGVYQAIRENGLEIGRDIALVTFDEMDLASHFDPPLSAIGPTDYDIGRNSVQLLVEQLENDVSTPRKVILEPTLTVRESSLPK